MKTLLAAMFASLAASSVCPAQESQQKQVYEQESLSFPADLEYRELLRKPLVADCGCVFPRGAKTAAFGLPPPGSQNIKAGDRVRIITFGRRCKSYKCLGGRIVSSGSLDMKVLSIPRSSSFRFRYILFGE